MFLLGFAHCFWSVFCVQKVTCLGADFGTILTSFWRKKHELFDIDFSTLYWISFSPKSIPNGVQKWVSFSQKYVPFPLGGLLEGPWLISC